MRALAPSEASSAKGNGANVGGFRGDDAARGGMTERGIGRGVVAASSRSSRLDAGAAGSPFSRIPAPLVGKREPESAVHLVEESVDGAGERLGEASGLKSCSEPSPRSPPFDGLMSSRLAAREFRTALATVGALLGALLPPALTIRPLLLSRDEPATDPEADRVPSLFRRRGDVWPRSVGRVLGEAVVSRLLAGPDVPGTKGAGAELTDEEEGRDRPERAEEEARVIRREEEEEAFWLGMGVGRGRAGS